MSATFQHDASPQASVMAILKTEEPQEGVLTSPQGAPTAASQAELHTNFAFPAVPLRRIEITLSSQQSSLGLRVDSPSS